MPDVLLFPGHAYYSREQLEQEMSGAETADIAERIDRVATAEFGLDARFDIRGEPGGKTVRLAGDSAGHADLAAFALSLARHRALRHKTLGPGQPPAAVLLGHSVGHLAALTCAGAFSVEDAARLIFYRNEAIAALPAGQTGMACLGLSAGRTRRLLGESREAAIACYNSPSQTVVAGPLTSLSRLRRLAVDDELLYVRLPAACAFHTELARPAVSAMCRLAAGVRQRPLRCAVFSATMRRFCTDGDDHVAEMARDLARPVYFLHAVRRLRAGGASGFTECGPTALLTRLVAEILPGATVDLRARTVQARPVQARTVQAHTGSLAGR
jgi:[acyl-carrier-protein] S-malonyltransferase